MFTKFLRVQAVKIGLIFAIALTACQTYSPPIFSPNQSKIIDLHTGKSYTPTELLPIFAKQTHILLGEQHDSAIQHQAQYWLLNQLNQYRPQGSLLLEMLSVDQQPLIAEAKKSHTAKADLPTKLNWQSSWNWAFYGDLVDYAIQQPMTLIATNLTSPEIKQIFAGAEDLAGTASIAPIVRQKIAELIIQNHQQTIDPDTLTKIVQIQQFRDRRMAEKLLNAQTPALLIAGNYHQFADQGIPLHLQEVKFPKPTIIIMSDNPQFATSAQADYLWLFGK